jgi:hypothetical protein
LAIGRWYVVSGRRQYDRRAMNGRECIRHGDKTASWLVPQGDDGRFDFYVAMNGRNAWHDLERPGVEVTPEDRADPVGLVRGKAAWKKNAIDRRPRCCRAWGIAVPVVTC